MGLSPWDGGRTRTGAPSCSNHLSYTVMMRPRWVLVPPTGHFLSFQAVRLSVFPDCQYNK